MSEDLWFRNMLGIDVDAVHQGHTRSAAQHSHRCRCGLITFVLVCGLCLQVEQKESKPLVKGGAAKDKDAAKKKK